MLEGILEQCNSVETRLDVSGHAWDPSRGNFSAFPGSANARACFHVANKINFRQCVDHGVCPLIGPNFMLFTINSVGCLDKGRYTCT